MGFESIGACILCCEEAAFLLGLDCWLFQEIRHRLTVAPGWLLGKLLFAHCGPVQQKGRWVRPAVCGESVGLEPVVRVNQVFDPLVTALPTDFEGARYRAEQFA